MLLHALKKRAPHMIRQQPNQTEFTDFIHPFGSKLPTSNRWIKLSQLVPWDEVQTLYSKGFKKTKMGAPALSGRIAFGALIIQERLCCMRGQAKPKRTHYRQFFYILNYTNIMLIFHISCKAIYNLSI